MQVEIEVMLAIQRALAQSGELFNSLEKARVAASQIKIPAGATASLSQSTAAVNANAAAIARNRATAQTASATIAQLNATIAASTAAAQAAANANNLLAQAMARINQAGNQSKPAIQSQSNAMDGLIGSVGRLAAGYFTLQAAWSFTSDSIKQSIAIENLTNTLTATSGSVAQATSDIAFLRQEANRIGISFLDSAAGFVKFDVAVKGAGMSGQFARDTFTALSEASRRLGLSGMQQGQVFLALEQMISKGVVLSQELRLQLGNALPGAFQTAARAMGLTTSELQKLVETGNLASTEFLPKFIHQLQKELPATAETLASTSAELNRLGNAWQEFKAQVGTGINPAVRGSAKLGSDIVEAASAALGNKDAQARLDRFIKERQDLQGYAEPGGIFGNDFLGLSGLFGAIGSGEGANPSGIIAKQDKLEQQRKKRATLAKEQQELIDNGVPQDDARIAMLKKYHALDRELSVQNLSEEATRRAKMEDDWIDKIERVKENKDNLTPTLLSDVLNNAERSKGIALDRFDEGEADKRHKKSLDDAIKSQREAEESAKRIRDIRIELIPDEQERKIERIKQKFEDFRKVIIGTSPDLFAAPNNIGAQIDAAQEQAIRDLKPAKSPTYFAGGDFASLVGQRKQLEQGLLTETDVEDYARAAQKIQEINQALTLQLKNNSAGVTQSLSLGFDEVAQSYGSFQERMANVGAGIAESLDSNLTDSITKSILSFESAGEAFQQMGLQIEQELLRIAVRELLVKNIIQGISNLSGLFGAAGGGGASGGEAGAAGGGGASGGEAGASFRAAQHRGGVVGTDGSSTQFYPRHHRGSGEIGDEKLVMARKGEVIFTPEQMKMLGSRGGEQKPITMITLFDRNTFDQMRAANPDAVVNEIGRNKTLIRQILG